MDFGVTFFAGNVVFFSEIVDFCFQNREFLVFGRGFWA